MSRTNNFENVLYTPEEISNILKISIKAVYGRVSRNKIPGVIRLGRSIRINANVFNQWLNHCVVMPETGVRQ